MITSGQVNRRDFLSTLLGTSVLLILQPFRTVARMGSSDCPETIAEQLSNFFIHKQSAEMIGREYVTLRPNESARTLLNELIRSFELHRFSMSGRIDTKELRNFLAIKQRQDFELSRIVNIKGWILSETEARLCALAALI